MRHPRNASIQQLPPHNLENPMAQRLEVLVERFEEVWKSIMPAVKRARQVIEEDTSDINFRDAIIRLFFFLSFLFELLGFVTDLNRSLSTIFWRLMGQGNFYILFSWPHIHTEVFGVDTIPLPCSEQVWITPCDMLPLLHLSLVTSRMPIKRCTRCTFFSLRMWARFINHKFITCTLIVLFAMRCTLFTNILYPSWLSVLRTPELN